MFLLPLLGVLTPIAEAVHAATETIRAAARWTGPYQRIARPAQARREAASAVRQAMRALDTTRLLYGGDEAPLKQALHTLQHWVDDHTTVYATWIDQIEHYTAQVDQARAGLSALSEKRIQARVRNRLRYQKRLKRLRGQSTR